MNVPADSIRANVTGATLPLLRWLRQPLASDWERLAILLMFAALVIARIPAIILQGRFWAEEGQIFFANAWTMPWWKALFATHTGYLNLVANVSGLLARYLVPLPVAPIVTATIALVIQCLPVVLILWGRAEWLQQRAVAVLAVLLILAPSSSEEVWLNSINSMNHLALAAGIILALEASAGRLALTGAILALAGLSSPASWVLAPLFALRALVERSWPRALQAAVLSCCVLIELGFFFSQIDKRTIGAPLTLVGGIIFFKNVMVPFLGRGVSKLLSPEFRSHFTAAGGPLWPLFSVIVLFSGAAAAMLRHPRQSPLWFLLAGSAIAVASYSGTLGDKVAMLNTVTNDRYVFAPQVLLALALLSWSTLAQGWLRRAGFALVVWMLALGLRAYLVPGSPISTTGPNWRDEVAQWQRDPARPLNIWPTGWTMVLPPK